MNGSSLAASTPIGRRSRRGESGGGRRRRPGAVGGEVAKRSVGAAVRGGRFWVVVALAAVAAAACDGRAPAVEVLRAPDGASLPQAAVDGAGRLHLVYYTGSMSSGDLWHVTREPASSAWSSPRRVNSRPHSVTGLGPVDGGQFAVGPDDRLHVTWFHGDPARFHYARTGADGAFEPQRTLSPRDEEGVETGSTVAVDAAGRVYVFWHAGASADADRRVHLAASRDAGGHFAPPRPVSPAAAGACGCCGLRAAADGAGAVHVSYRGAGDNVHRGMRLLTSTDGGRTFDDRLVQPWDIGACPVATTTLDSGPDGTLVAWETEGQVYAANTERLDRPWSPPGEAQFRRKNAAVAVNRRGDVLLAWGDGPGWQSGGNLHWQAFDARGRPRGDPGRGGAPIPARSVPTVAARPDGSFVIVY